MTLEKTHHIAHLVNQLAEMLMTVVICSEEIRTAILAELDGDGRLRRADSHGSESSGESSLDHRPFVDSSTLSLLWDGKTCRLGGKVLFRLAERLCRRPNQYILVDDLLRDVWQGDQKSLATFRSAVRRLRQRVRASGMDALAPRIMCICGRCGLILDGSR